MKKLLWVVSAIILCLVVFSGCGISINPGINVSDKDDSSDTKTAVTGDVKVDNSNIKIGDGVKTIKTEFNMGTGILNVKGGSSDAMDAEFMYNIPSWKPEVTSNNSGALQQIIINQPKTKSFNTSNTKYTWNVKLNNNLMQDITLNMGAGKGNIDLKDVKLENLDVHCGVGDITLDLSGNYPSDVDISIKGGVGKSTIYIPKNMGVKVKAMKGIGSFKYSGLERNGDEYTNESFGKTPKSINISVEAGVGDINIVEK